MQVSPFLAKYRIPVFKQKQAKSSEFAIKTISKKIDKKSQDVCPFFALSTGFPVFHYVQEFPSFAKAKKFPNDDDEEEGEGDEEEEEEEEEEEVEEEEEEEQEEEEDDHEKRRPDSLAP